MNTLKCQNCGLTNFAGAEKCKKCDVPLASNHSSRRRSQPTAGQIPADAFVCTACGTLCKPFKQGRGSVWVDAILFLVGLVCLIFINWILGMMLIAASVAYLAFRSSGKTVCPTCEAPNPIPATSPVAQQFLAKIGK